MYFFIIPQSNKKNISYAIFIETEKCGSLAGVRGPLPSSQHSRLDQTRASATFFRGPEAPRPHLTSHRGLG